MFRKAYTVIVSGVLVAAACLLLSAPRAQAQVLYGSIVGQVMRRVTPSTRLTIGRLTWKS